MIMISKKLTLLQQQEYLERQARMSHPSGKFDSAGRWYPSDAEHASCCDSVRSPSRAYRYAYMTHARTMHHILTRDTEHARA